MKLLAAALFVACSVISINSGAAVNITIRQVGSDVVGTASGSLNLTGSLGGATAENTSSGILLRGASGYYYAVGSGAHSQRSVTGGWLTEQQLYAANTVHPSTSSVGDFVGVSFASAIAHLQYPNGYNSGDPINGTSTWAGQTIGSLGLVPGTYVFDYGTDRVTFNVVDPTPQPVPSLSLIGLILTALGLGTLGFAKLRKGRA